MNLNDIQFIDHKSYYCCEDPGINHIDVHVSIVESDITTAFLNWSHNKIINMNGTFETIKTYYPIVKTYLIAIWDWDTINQTIILNLGFTLKGNGIIGTPPLTVLIYQKLL